MRARSLRRGSAKPVGKLQFKDPPSPHRHFSPADPDRLGELAAQFLLLGSASPEPLQQSSETLAGRISYLELIPLLLAELDDSPATLERHWFRGGFPDSYLAGTDAAAMRWCEDFITSHLERHLPQLGVSANPFQLRRFCSMLAHQQGGIVNCSQTGTAPGLDGQTVRRYLDRSLPAWSRNAGKRLVKSPKLYWRNSGLLHGLAELPNLEHVLGHPLCGHSWEGYCIEQILGLLPPGTRASHYRTQAGAEVDLVLEHADWESHAIEIKRTLSPKRTPPFRESMTTLGATRGTYLIPAGDSFPLSEQVTATSLSGFLRSPRA